MRADHSDGVAIQTKDASLVDYPVEISGVGGVVTVIDFDFAEIDTLFFEDRDLSSRHLSRGVGMHHDEHPGLQVRARDGSGHSFQGGVIPSKSAAHLSIPALISVPRNPSVRSLMNSSAIWLAPTP